VTPGFSFSKAAPIYLKGFERLPALNIVKVFWLGGATQPDADTTIAIAKTHANNALFVPFIFPLSSDRDITSQDSRLHL